VSAQKPLVIADDKTGAIGQPITQRLQAGDDLDIPLADRVDELSERFNLLTTYLAAQGIELPGEFNKPL
jgi:hypothetical protein